jgi:glycosyltransferase involved in cell wall biosynthesis
MSEYIGLPTLDVRETAGTATVTQFTYDLLSENDYEPYILFNSIPWDECLTIKDLMKGNWEVNSQEGTYNGMKGVRISRVFPELAVTNYLLNNRRWQQALENTHKNLVVGGTCLQGLPLARNDIPFGCWIGTTLRDQGLSDGSDSYLRLLRDTLSSHALYRFEKYVLEKAETVIVQSGHTKASVVETTELSPNNVKVIPFPIDINKFKLTERNHGKEILFVGRFNAPRKNIFNLLIAFNKVLERFPDATLTLVGEEPNTGVLKKIKELGIKSSVKFPGTVPDVVPYYQHATVFVLPSNQEGLGIVGLEAQSCATPVVSTDCGGPTEYIEHGSNGYIVPRDDPSKLAAHIERLLADEELWESFAYMSRKNVVENFSEEIVASALLEEIESLPTTSNSSTVR